MAKLVSDPSLPDVVRNQAKAGITSSIDVALASGLISTDEASKMRKAGIEDGENALAVNRAELAIEFGDPAQVLKDMAIPKWNSGHKACRRTSTRRSPSTSASPLPKRPGRRTISRTSISAPRWR
jgi:hypothetical protein